MGLLEELFLVEEVGWLVYGGFSFLLGMVLEDGGVGVGVFGDMGSVLGFRSRITYLGGFGLRR